MIEWSSEAHLNLETVAHLTAHLGLNFFILFYFNAIIHFVLLFSHFAEYG